MSDKDGMDFVEVALCADPMESELLPAALREKDIPHRTRRDEQGRLVLLAAADWRQEAEAALTQARQVFFAGLDSAPKKIRRRSPALAQSEEADGGYGLFAFDALPTPEETRHKAVWPAYVLAAAPGLGLGHLYAGKFQIFFYLFFCSLLGVLFFHFTRSFWSFGFNVFAWGVDLGFAAFHVRDHNARAERARRRLAQMEQEFFDSVEGEESP